jgi:hypothetical protein
MKTKIAILAALTIGAGSLQAQQMNKLIIAIITALTLASCATSYQPKGFTGGFSDFMVASDEAVITFNGNGFTDVMRVLTMAGLRCSEVTLAHGYKYFIVTEFVDMSSQSSFTTPGYANTYGGASVYGNFIAGSATTTFTPPMTHTINKPGVMVAIKMSNNKSSLDSLGATINGQKFSPKDAAFFSNSLRQFLGKKTNQQQLMADRSKSAPNL